MRNTPPTLSPERLEIADQFFFRLQQCANMLHKTGTRIVGDDKLTTQQCAILGTLMLPKAQGGLSVGDLARHLMVSRQNLSGILIRMLRAGYLVATIDPRDRRSRLISLTDTGREVWEAQVRPKLHLYYEQALAGLSPDDIHESLMRMLTLLENMKAMDNDS